jgi:hypothetical protein
MHQQACLCNHQTIVDTEALIRGEEVRPALFDHFTHHLLQSFVAYQKKRFSFDADDYIER